MFKNLINFSHQTPFSRAIKRNPILGAPARFIWRHHQSNQLKTTLKNAFSTKKFREKTANSICLPTKENFLNPTVSFKDAGDNFSHQLDPFDTSKFHTMAYQYLYGNILKQIPSDLIRNILEIGMGTNNPNKPSGMPESHIPGTSLRGWKSLYPAAQVFGADVDKSILHDTPEYKTIWVDQLSKSSLKILAEKIRCPLDLIVDDGLHTPEANANCMAMLLPHLSPHGIFVVEDILEEFDDLWENVASYLGGNFKYSFIPCSALNPLRSESTGMGIAVITRA